MAVVSAPQCIAVAAWVPARIAPLVAAAVAAPVVSGNQPAQLVMGSAGIRWATRCRPWVCMLAAEGCGTPEIEKKTIDYYIIYIILLNSSYVF